MDEFCSELRQVLKSRLSKRQETSNPIRFSSLGKPNRQMWYDAHPDGTEHKLKGSVLFKFLYGDILESLVLYLAKEAGHEVTDQQAEVEVDGIFGHIDAIVDGVVVDAKSASPFGYKKFEQRNVTGDDPFGYVDQLSGYSNVLSPTKDAAWIAIDKVSGDICVSPLPYTVIKHHQPLDRIKELKEVVSREEPPERCYEDVPDGASGNRKLVAGCGYCRHRNRCWPNLRTFAYAGQPRFLTKVVVEPKVPEIK